MSICHLGEKGGISDGGFESGLGVKKESVVGVVGGGGGGEGEKTAMLRLGCGAKNGETMEDDRDVGGNIGVGRGVGRDPGFAF